MSLSVDLPEVGAAFYRGTVMHKRLIPFRHKFDYRVFSLLVDIDRLQELDRAHRWFGYNRSGLISVRDRDHGPRDGSPLRPFIEETLRAIGVAEVGRISLLAMPRVMNYVFNPLSLYFVEDRAGTLRWIVHEVRNTFGEMHHYPLPVDGSDPVIRQGCSKDFYVSPFIGMQSDYRFRLRAPDDRLSVLIRQSVPDGELLIATLTGRRSGFSDAGILKCLAAHPALTWKVMIGIHWEALKLWIKGAKYHPKRHSVAPKHGASGSLESST